MLGPNGQIEIPQLGEPPAPLTALLTQDTPEARHYRSHIRDYNSRFCMASAKTKCDPLAMLICVVFFFIILIDRLLCFAVLFVRHRALVNSTRGVNFGY